MKENQHIEWKETWRDEYLKWLCGFANAEGGVLVIGRNDKGVITGLPHAAKLMEDIPNKVRDILGIMVEVNLRDEAEKEYLEIVTEPYPNPVNYRGEYYIRSGSTNQTLKGAALDRFLLRRQGRHWDSVPIPHVAIKDLSKSVVDSFRKLARESRRLDSRILRESMPGLIEKLHLLDGQYLKRAAVLLFHPDPERFVTGAYVKIGFFRSNTELLYQDEIHSDLFTQVEKTMDLLLSKYLKAGISYRGIQRIEKLPVPEEALREAVLNAIIHKDYASGTPIQISVYADKLMLWNSGELPQNWTVAKLKRKHPSQPFNPDIANVFFRAGRIEAWGRGIERIFDACKTAGFPEPIIRYGGTGLWAEFAFLKNLTESVAQEAAVAATPITTPIITPITTPITTQEITQETTQETTQEKILVLLKATPTLTRRQLAKKIGVSEDGIKYHLDKLRLGGFLRHVGSTKAGRWEVLK